ncbi:hypothetical protein HDR60_00945 [bacterium]|nr:hypothetical protein [bacterium]
MKNNLKISLIALSTLLTACGGGNGGGNSVPNTTLPTTVEASNRQITSLKSRIDLTKEKPESVRSATSTSRAKQYADISDIKFTVFDEGENSSFKFNVDDNGKIVSFSDENGETVFKRNNENKFIYDGPEGDHEMYQELTFESMGKELGLSYFDFFRLNGKSIEYGTDENGKYIPKEESDDLDEYQLGVFGGYKEREISPDKIEKDIASIDFTGRAIGGVSAEENIANQGSKEGNINLDGKATLHFDNGANPTSTLTMNFDNWYDVVVTDKFGESDVNVKFEKFTGEDDLFKFKNGEEKNALGGLNNFTLNYYYDDLTNTVVEAGGGMEIIEAMRDGEEYTGNDFKDENRPGISIIDFNAAFGLKRD